MWRQWPRAEAEGEVGQAGDDGGHAGSGQVLVVDGGAGVADDVQARAAGRLGFGRRGGDQSAFGGVGAEGVDGLVDELAAGLKVTWGVAAERAGVADLVG